MAYLRAGCLDLLGPINTFSADDAAFPMLEINEKRDIKV